MTTRQRQIRDVLASMVRTYTPYAATWALGALGRRLGIPLPTEELAAASVVIVGSLWHGIVRVLEERWPALGWFLGLPVPPTYELPTPPRAA